VLSRRVLSHASRQPVPQLIVCVIRLGNGRVDAYLQRHYTSTVDQIQFVWDPRKAAANQRRHRVPFAEAETVFSDDNAILLDDAAHSDDEPRYVLLGLSERFRILVVSHTVRDRGRTIRLISARKATQREREQYLERVMP
jgi:uncharacterized DUF497 family protein